MDGDEPRSIAVNEWAQYKSNNQRRRECYNVTIANLGLCQLEIGLDGLVEKRREREPGKEGNEESQPTEVEGSSVL